MRIEKVKSFYKEYIEQKETDLDNISRVCNKLLNVNYICPEKESDKNDYYYILSNLNLIKNYFSVMDYEVNFYEINKVITLSNKEGYNRLRLKKLDSIILLILRKMFQIKMDEVSMHDNIFITLEELHNEIANTNIVDKRLNKGELTKILNQFKKSNLIDYNNKDITNDDAYIIIYPTIIYAVNYETIEMIDKKLQSYNVRGELDEETSESEAD